MQNQLSLAQAILAGFEKMAANSVAVMGFDNVNHAGWAVTVRDARMKVAESYERLNQFFADEGRK